MKPLRVVLFSMILTVLLIISFSDASMDDALKEAINDEAVNDEASNDALNNDALDSVRRSHIPSRVTPPFG